ncbi:hypothetical protein M3P36_05890 [Altererythrobacter sp. KTW20L]|uniref:PRC-barrel domain-containing protein n=1 Tax=Altererythrobacter sp. KTW20L TaxID=2942210 RepID=UPI0020BEE1E8|nr:hypothetical protein [Altererythrobacter sp. KTW20L]MCL6250573.1 hypothetical protein [Altererythrobacter sp. KTW20L]
MKKFLIAVSSVALFATPAQAQLLGGSGGLGGVVGGTIGGGASGSFPDVGGTLERTRSSTRGTLDSAASTSGEQRVDRRSGRVDANRRADARGSAGIGQVVDNPIAPLTGDASASGSAGGEGNASAQLVGTDAVRGLAGQGASQASSAAQATQSAATGLASQGQATAGEAASSSLRLTGSLGGSASGNGAATGSAGGSLADAMLATAGSAAASGDGAFAVQPGMDVLVPGGEKLGEVSQVIADANGRISEVIVEQGDREVAMPAADLRGNGSALFALDGSGQVD